MAHSIGWHLRKYWYLAWNVYAIPSIIIVGCAVFIITLSLLHAASEQYAPYSWKGEALLATQIHDLQADVNALRTEVATQRNAK